MALIEELSRQGVKLWTEGGKLRYRGSQSILTPGMLGQLKAQKQQIIEYLSPTEPPLSSEEEVIQTPLEVLEIAREVLPLLREEDRVDLAELIQANQPPAPGRDPLVKRDTDKAHFFQAPAECGCGICMPSPRYVRRYDGKTYAQGGTAV